MTTLKGPVTDPARLRRARLSVFTIFGFNGLLLAMWVVNVPAVQAQAGVSHSTLGLLLLLMGAGAIAGMQIAGPMADRVGTGTATIVGGALLCLAVNLPGLAVNAVTLGVAVFIFGLANGTLDVSMNGHAVVVERGYGRPIMSAFHALFSIGGAAGALLGAGLIAADWSLQAILLGPALLGAVALAVSAPGLLKRADEGTPEPAAEKGPAGRRSPMSKVVWLLGCTTFLLMLAEGVAYDWSALQITERLGAPESVAAFGYGAFAVTMTLGRLVADRVVARTSPVAVVRYGALIGAVGLTMITASDRLWLTLLGWGIVGLGLSGAVPQLFTAAGNLPSGSTGVNMSRVVGMGYVGLLAGPALVGWLGDISSLSTAMLAPLLFCVVAAGLATSLRAARRPGEGSATIPSPTPEQAPTATS